jgi:pimeloyl-ACP methyl ester carboxylesterase
MANFHPVSDLLSLCSPNATWNLGPCAEVRVGDHVTRYVRRGSGPSVVLVGADATANPVWKPLVERLATGRRIVVPQPPPKGVDVATWLRGFIEGLGLSDVVLVAGDGISNAALELAATDDFLVRKLVLMPTDGDSVVDATPGRTLWVKPGAAVEDSLRQIEEFIAGDGAT